MLPLSTSLHDTFTPNRAPPFKQLSYGHRKITRARHSPSPLQHNDPNQASLRCFNTSSPSSSGTHLNLHLRSANKSRRCHAHAEQIGQPSSANQQGGSPLHILLHNFSSDWQIGNLLRDISYIALPAMVAQAVEPIAQLTETAYIGRIGSVELAAVGVSLSIFNLVSKVFNIPLLNVTTSLVAEDDALVNAHCPDYENQKINQEQRIEIQKSSIDDVKLKKVLAHELVQREPKKRLIPAVSTALVFGILIGILEASILAMGAGGILNVMGISEGSQMYAPAKRYLRLRAMGSPAFVLVLAMQGVFRGLKDTKTALYATMAGSLVNVILDTIFILLLGFGINGAAIATVTSQYIMAFLLLWKLGSEFVLLPPKRSELRLYRFLKSGSFLFGRTVAVLSIMTLATSMAARQGAVSMAGHQILMQIWLASSLLSDALALSGQTLMANAFANGNLKRVKEVTFGILQTSLAFGLFMAAILSLCIGPLSKLFTNDTAVLGILRKGTLFIVATQPLNALAFVFDGIHYGASDFAYAAYSMICSSLFSSLLLFVASSFFGLPGVWIGLTILMASRAIAGILRLGTGSGPWRFLRLQK